MKSCFDKIEVGDRLITYADDYGMISARPDNGNRMELLVLSRSVSGEVFTREYCLNYFAFTALIAGIIKAPK